MKKAFLLILFLASAFYSQAEGRFEFTPNVRKAYEYTLSLRLEEAYLILEIEKQADPNNLTIYFVENYLDFFRVFINENEIEFESLFSGKEERLKMIRTGDSNSPYYLFTQADIHLQWALLMLKFEQNFNAARTIRKAYKLLEENEARFPDFMPNRKSLGVLHALIGTIPDKYKTLAKIVGLTGSISQGMGELEDVIRFSHNHDFIFEEESMVMYVFLMMHIGNRSDEAWDVLKRAKLDVRNNPLACFVVANMSMYTGRNDEAIRILSERPRGSQYHPFHYLDYMMGLAKLNRLDEDSDVLIRKYVKNFKGQNYIKEAYQKLAWHALLFSSETAYFENMAKCKIYGKSIVDEDKKAMWEALYGPVPNKVLLKTQLLFDGGYYDKAEKTLSVKTVSDFSIDRDKIEYYYRFGRIYHKLGKTAEAKKYYDYSIEHGESQPYYFACNAALQSGLIYEKEKDFERAKEYFRLCLSMKPEEYKNSLHQKAKAGLNRVKG